MVIGGYGDGTMRVCSSRSGTVLVEVHAHSRWINSIDVAKDTGLVYNNTVLILTYSHTLTLVHIYMYTIHTYTLTLIHTYTHSYSHTHIHILFLIHSIH